MNSPNRAYLFLSLALLAAAVSPKTTDLTFPLHKGDEFCVNINNLLSGDQMLNDLKVSKSGDFSVIVPQAIEEKSIPDFLPDSIDPKSIGATATFGKRLAVVAKSKDGQTVGIVFKYDPKTSKVETAIFQLAPDNVECPRLFMDESILMTFCYSPSEKHAMICSVDHAQNGFYGCTGGLTFGSQDIRPIPDGRIEMDSFGGRGKNRLFAFYFKSGSGAYHDIKHSFYLQDNSKTWLLSLESGLTVLSVSITSYDFARKLANLLVFAQDAEGKRSLRYYTVENYLITKQNGHEYERFDVDPVEVYFKDYSLFIVEAPDAEGNLVIRRVNLKERKFPKMHLKGQKSATRINGSRNLFLFETEDAADGHVNWFLLDTFCDRFYKFDQVMPDIRNHRWTVMQIGYESFIVVMKDTSAVFYKVLSFQSVCATFPQDGFVKGELDFEVAGTPALKAHLENYGFDALLTKDIVSPHVALSTDIGSERQFHLDIHGNDLDFQEGSNVYYFHAVQMISAEDPSGGMCVPLRVLIKNRNLIYMCQDNRVVVYSSYALDFAAKTFEFKFKSTFSFPDFDLSAVKEVKLYYNQYLALISDNNRFTYIDLNSEADTLPVTHSDELRQYDRCVFSKHNVLCQKDRYFVVLGVTKNNEQLVFSVVNAHVLLNTLLESVIVSQYHQNTLYYIRKSFNKEATNHLIQEIDRVDRKMSRNRIPISGDHSKFIELNKDEFVVIDWANGLQIGGLVGESFALYPFNYAALFADVICIRVVEEAKVFMVFYRTNHGKVRLYVGRSSLRVYDRLIKDIEVGDFQEGVQMEAHFITWSQILVMVYRKGDPKFSRSFLYYLNGPVYFIEKDSQTSEIRFMLNGKQISRPFAPNEPLDPLRVVAKEVHIRDPEGSETIKNLETGGELTIAGGVRDFEESSEKNPDVSVTPRIHWTDHKLIKRSNARGLDTHLSRNLASSFGDFSFFYGDLVVTRKEQRANQLYKSCKFIDRGDLGSNANPRLLCRDKARNDNVITNLVDDPIFLDAPEVRLTAFNLIEEAGTLFFFARTTGSKNLHFWKFKKQEAGYELESRRVVVPNDYFLGNQNIESFFTTARLIPGKIVVLIHEAFSPRVSVKILGVKSNVFEKYNFEEVPLLEAGKKESLSIYDMKCADTPSAADPKDIRVRCLVRSDQYLYDTLLSYTEGAGFAFTIETRYPFWRNQFLEHNIGLFASGNFVAVFTKARSGNDVFVYRRYLGTTGQVKTSHLFGSFQVKDTERIVKISISDPTQAQLDKKTPELKDLRLTDSSLWVAMFTDPLLDSDVYKNLYVNHYSLSEFKVKAKSKADRVNNDLELRFTDQTNALHTVNLRVVIEHNFVLKLLLWIFLILILVFVGLAVFVVMTYHENKRIKNALLRQGHNQSMFLDRTVMQI